MPVTSAGILLHHPTGSGELVVWIVHPGGPFWWGKDDGAWSIPKGEFEHPEDPLEVALREFAEEMGAPPPETQYERLGEFVQPSRKVITVFVAKAEFDVDLVRSNTFDLEWPKGSGRVQHFPEVDQARWFTAAIARTKLLKGQVPILDELERRLAEQ